MPQSNQSKFSKWYERPDRCGECSSRTGMPLISIRGIRAWVCQDCGAEHQRCDSHRIDPSTIAQASGEQQVIDASCVYCGCPGSFSAEAIDAEQVNWEEVP